ncbi:MAG: hypothetical protein KC609_00855, partial [Myxococcales bacterium]|nr:hypothetical protein [Myxococcales bacterium]
MRNSADIARLCAMTAAFVVVCAALTQAPGCAKKSKAVVTGCSLGSHCPTTGTCYVPTGQCVARCDTYATCNNPSHEQCIFASGLEPQCVPSEEVEIDPRFHSEDANGPDTSGEDVSKDLIFGTEDSGGEDRVGGEDAVTSDTGDPDL